MSHGWIACYTIYKAEEKEMKVKNWHYYLCYSFILLFPPVHELGHYIIAQCINEQVTRCEWLCVWVIPNQLDYFHDLWEYSILIPLVCTILWAFFEYRKIQVGRNALHVFR